MIQVEDIPAPRINTGTILRLLAFVRPTRLTSASTMYDAGYEAAKLDMHDIIINQLPAYAPNTPNTAERAMQKRSEAPQSMLARILGR